MLLWVRGQRVRDGIAWTSDKSPYLHYDLTSGLGTFFLECIELRQPKAGAFEFEYWSHRATPLNAEYRTTWHGFVYQKWADPNWYPDHRAYWQPRYYWSIPYWFPVLITGVLPATALYHRMRRRARRRPAGYCVTCGYDCRATPERCPECGTVQTAKGGRKPLGATARK